MRHPRHLLPIAAFAATSLLGTGLAIGCLLFALDVLSPSELWSAGGAFVVGLSTTLLLGTVPSVLMGAPGYWLLWRHGRATWPPVILMGAVLGSLVAVWEPALVAWGIGCGVIVASLTHLATKRWLGLNA